MTTQPAENGSATRCDLTAIRARSDAATEGPWGAADEHGLMEKATPAWCVSRMADAGKWLHDVAFLPQSRVPAQEEADAEFMAHARTDIPDLLAEVERLRGALSDITAFIDEELFEEDGLEYVPAVPLLAVLGRVGITANEKSRSSNEG